MYERVSIEQIMRPFGSARTLEDGSYTSARTDDADGGLGRLRAGSTAISIGVDDGVDGDVDDGVDGGRESADCVDGRPGFGGKDATEVDVAA